MSMANAAMQRDWQTVENQRDRVWQQSEYDRRFNMSNEYNDPSAVVQRLRQAGINPAAAMGQLSGTGGLAAAGGSSASVPSHQVQPVGYQPPNIGAELPAILSAVADLKNAETNVGHLGNETRQTDATIESLLASANKQNAEAEMQKLLTSLQDMYGAKKLDAEILNLLAQAQLAADKSDTEKVNQIVGKAEEYLMRAKGDTEVQSRPMVLSNLSTYRQVLLSQIDANKASANASNASARLNNALAQTEDGLRSGKIHGQQLANDIAGIQRQIFERNNAQDARTYESRVNSILEQCEQQGFITEKMKADAASAMAHADWAYINEFLGALGSAVGSFSEVVGSFSKLQRNEILNKVSRQVQRSVEHRSKNDDGSTVVDRYSWNE